MEELQQLRKEINQVDTEMARLFEKRMQVCAKIASYKKERGLSVKDPDREAALIEKNRALISDPKIEAHYIPFLKKTIEVSCEYQSELLNGMRVTYCGAEGAFAYIAAKRMFPTAELFAFPDFASAYQAVQDGSYDCAVLPLENSYAGEVGSVMDLLFSGDLSVNQVTDIDITHHLVACPCATKETIRRVVSHPQALHQCSGYLHESGWETQSYSNTALAAKYVQQANDPTIAAIASAQTAELYGLVIIDSEINDAKNNATRFAAFSRAQNRALPNAKREDENFILVFTVQNESGSLAKALNIIGAHGFNLRNLRSRPMKDLQWNYYFYLEAEGNVHTENGRDLLRELSAVCAKLRLIGSYYAKNVQP